MVGIVQFKGKGNHERNDLNGTEELGARNNRGCVCVCVCGSKNVTLQKKGEKNGKERLKEIANGNCRSSEKREMEEETNETVRTIGDKTR